MRPFILSIVAAIASTSSVVAHHPDHANKPVRQYIDVIPPLGNNLKMSYRRKYNRPRNLKGRIAYYVAPSSQEAMAWHNATHRGHYENHRPRIVTHYFYAKPWEALKTGPRAPVSGEMGAMTGYGDVSSAYGDQPTPAMPIENLDEMALPSEDPIPADGMIE